MGFRKHIQAASDWLKRVVTQPRSELTRWQAAVRFAYDLSRYGARQLYEDRAFEMAAALAFRTLFAIFPIMVVAGAFFQGLYGREPFREFIRNMIEGLGLSDVPILTLDDPVETADDAAVVANGGVDGPEVIAGGDPIGETAGTKGGSTGDMAEPPAELGSWLEDFIFRITDIDLNTLGWIGFVVVVYASITMMVTIEESFNTVYRTAQGRAWTRRIPIYWTVLTMGGIVIWMLFQIDDRVGEWVGRWAAIGIAARTIWTFTIIWLALFGIYTLVPNTIVAWRTALAGSFFAGLGVFVGKELLAGYVSTFVTVRQLAGAIGFVPLLMFWVYVMWLIILFGLEISATLQNLGGRRNMEEMEQKRPRYGMIDPASVLLVMEVIAERFREGKPASARQISEQTAIPSSIVSEMIERLTAAGLVHRVDHDETCATLAKPPDQISAEHLIEVGYGMVDELTPSRRTDLIRRLREAERTLASNATLASLLQAHDAARTVERATDQAAEAK